MAAEILDPTGFPLEENDLLAPFHHRINAYLRSLPDYALVRHWWNGKTDWDKVRAAYKEGSLPILELPEEEQLGCIRACARYSNWFRFERDWRAVGQKPNMDDHMAYERALNSLCAHILKQDREWSEEDIQRIVEIDIPYGFEKDRTEAVSPLVETYLQRHTLTDSLRPSVELVREWNATPQRLTYWVSLGTALGEPLVLHRGEKWADEVIAFIKVQPEVSQMQWHTFLLHCIRSEKTKPSAKWLQIARQYLDEIGANVFENCFCAWCDRYLQSPPYDQLNQAVFKGFVWSASLEVGEQIPSSIANIALGCVKANAMTQETFSLRLFNACMWALSQSPSPGAKGQLLELKGQVHNSRFNALDKALETIDSRSCRDG